MEKFKEIMLIIGQLLLKGLKAFWAFMVKPNKKSKVSKWKFLVLGIVLLIGYANIQNYLDRPVVSDKGAETVSFTVNGTYSEGADIKSGTYYVLLTKYSNNTDSHVNVEIESKNGRYSFFHEFLNEVGVTERVSIPIGARVKIDGYENSYEVSFFTEEDYKNQNIKSKYPVKSKTTTTELPTTSSSATETTTETTTTSPSTTETTTTASEAPTTTESTGSSTVFSPQDVSDATIESIKTYNDYLIMYDKIIEDYFAQYESVIKDTILYDQTTFEEMKKGYKEAAEEQRKQYGVKGNALLIGKNDLVEFLKDYRDSLKSAVDSVKASLQ